MFTCCFRRQRGIPQPERALKIGRPLAPHFAEVQGFGACSRMIGYGASGRPQRTGCRCTHGEGPVSRGPVFGPLFAPPPPPGRLADMGCACQRSAKVLASTGGWAEVAAVEPARAVAPRPPSSVAVCMPVLEVITGSRFIRCTWLQQADSNRFLARVSPHAGWQAAFKARV